MPRLPGRSKYNVDQTELGKLKRTYKGRVYRSEAEANYARHLDLLIRAGEVKSWEYEPTRIPIMVNGIKVCTYTPDFWVVLADGSTEVHEVKGRETTEWILKHSLLKATWLLEPTTPVYRVIK